MMILGRLERTPFRTGAESGLLVSDDIETGEAAGVEIVGPTRINSLETEPKPGDNVVESTCFSSTEGVDGLWLLVRLDLDGSPPLEGDWNDLKTAGSTSTTGIEGW